jgi:4-aminobutyrate aminotransferase-like enzyme
MELAAIRCMALRAKRNAHEVKRLDRRLIGRDHPATDLQIVSAEGSIVRDVRGRTYVDLVMGWCVGNLGWNHPAIRERMAAFKGPDYVAPGSLYAPWTELAQRLAEVTPAKLVRCYRATTGTEAVEVAMQIARTYTGRDRVISVADDYHGNSIAVKEIDKVIAPPLDDTALARLERTLKGKKVAALIMEPIITNLGVMMPSPGFMEGAIALCRRHGTLFISDEVASGFGRTGRLFATEHADIEPDILCLAKAVTNGAAALAATITTAEIGDAVAGDLDFYATFGWLPRSCEAALAVLDVWRRDGEEIFDNVNARSTQLVKRFHDLDLPEDYEVRVKGLAIGIDLPDGVEAEAIAERCRRNGLILSGEEGQLSLFPALTIDEATLDRGIDVLADCLPMR